MSPKRFISLDQQETAKKWLEKVVKQYPDTDAAKRAKRLLENPGSEEDGDGEGEDKK